MGVPRVEDGRTHWSPPHELARLNEGRWLLCIDEMPQAVVMMQNALAGLMLDRFVGDLSLSPEVYIIATGNRTQDKAGANRVVSQLANRVMHLEMEPHLDDWCDWAFDKGIDVTLISFLRFRPNLLCDFDPDRFSNPTPRMWEKCNDVPGDLPAELYHAMVSGLVGEGAAAEYIGFKQIAEKMPNPDALLLNPKDAPVPDDPATLYALSGALAVRASQSNFDNLMTYTDRMPAEFQVLLVKDSLRADKKLANTKAFIGWASKHGNVLIG